jgi:hypothetical protein
VRASFLILMASAAVLGGCANKPDPAVQAQTNAQARAADDDAKCRSYGAKPGEPAYVQCRVALDNERAQPRATVAGALVGGSLSHPQPQPVTTPAPPVTTNCEATSSIFNCQ